MFWFAESVRFAYESIRTYGFRSLLATLGITIAVAASVSVLTLLRGLQGAVLAELNQLSGATISIVSHTPRDKRMEGRVARLTVGDLHLLRERVPKIRSITPIIFLREGSALEVRYAGRTSIAQVLGTTHFYQDTTASYAAIGRFLTASDDRRRRRVCVVGAEVSRQLGLPENPVGEYLQLGNEWLKVVGVMEARGSFFGQSQDNYVVVPYETLRRFNDVPGTEDTMIQLSLVDVGELEFVVERVRTLLRAAHKLTRTDEDDFTISTSDQILGAFERVANSVTAVIVGIVAISLLVGGIGVMNIMLVSVTNRTREIGICKAIGAKRQHILWQFLAEACVLSLLGGCAGLVFGVGLALFVSSMIPGIPPASVSWLAVLLSIGFSGAVGVLFGIMPAARAADLEPVEALRYA